MHDNDRPTRVALQASLALNTELFGNCFEGIDDDTAGRQVSADTNNMAFIGCHAVDARFYLARLLGVEVGDPFSGRLEGVDSIAEATELPAVEEIRASFEEVGGVLAARLDAISEEDLAQPVTQQFPIADGSTRGAIVFLLAHEAFHLGQLSLLRKLLGLAAMSWDVAGPDAARADR